MRFSCGLFRAVFFVLGAAHEVAHHSFGQIIGGETYHDLRLEEGFAQYTAGLSVLLDEIRQVDDP